MMGDLKKEAHTLEGEVSELPLQVREGLSIFWDDHDLIIPGPKKICYRAGVKRRRCCLFW